MTHRDCGAIIVSSQPGNGVEFTEWIDKMVNLNWHTSLTLGYVTEVIYTQGLI